MRRDILKRPAYVLVLSQLACEGARLLAAHAQDAIVCRKHCSVDDHDLLILMISPEQLTATLLNRTHWDSS